MQTFTTATKFITVLALLSSLFMASCQKDKDNNHTPSPAPSKNRLTEYTNGENFVRLEYNADGTVKKATVSDDLGTNGNTIEYNVNYNAAKKISNVQTSAGEEIVPIYENGVMTRADILEAGVRHGYFNYHYENQTLKSVTVYYGEDPDYEPFFSMSFETNENGNITQAVAFAANGVPGYLVRMGHINFKHDTKVNPLYAHKDLLALMLQNVSKNNIIEEDHFDATLALEDHFVYTYTYKSNGLPQHAVVRQGLPGQTPVVTEADFTYR